MIEAPKVPSPLFTLQALLVAELRAFCRNARALIWTWRFPC